MRDIKETAPVRVYLLRPLVKIPEGNRGCYSGSGFPALDTRQALIQAACQ
jgi:hypothetical protein